MAPRHFSGGGVLFKRCERTGEDLGNVILSSYNKEYPDFIRPSKDVYWLYPVIRILVNSR